MHTRLRTRAALALLTLVWAQSAVSGQNRIYYSVALPASGRDLAVSITTRATKTPIRYQIPTWSPGAYFVGNFADSISDVSAADSKGGVLTVTHPDKQTWEITTPGTGDVTLSYRVTNSDIEYNGTTPKRAHISGPRTFMYVVGHKQDPAEISVVTRPTWKIATSLDDPLVIGSVVMKATYLAPNYDVLADAPVEMGDFLEDDFEVKGVQHRVVLYGKTDTVDRAKLLDYCKRVAAIETSFFHDIPYKRYVFEFRSAGGNAGGAGGLEHLGSTEIFLRGQVEDRVRSVIAHEFFHLWNVKRIRPFVLGPFDYIDPPHTHNLWWSEGVTSYYGDLLSRRGGLNTDQEYFKHLSDLITELQNNPARLKVSADDSSWHVWEANNSQGYGGLSYYTKGELVGLCLDARIRKETNGKHSLDDVMRGLYAQCGRGRGPGFGEDDIRTWTSRVARKNLSDFYDLLARSTQEMPLAECLSWYGLKANASDKPEIHPSLGMSLAPSRTGTGLRVAAVEQTGAAESAGIKQGDVVTAIDGKPADFESFGRLRSAATHAKFTLTVQREGQSLDLPFEVGTETRTPWIVTPDPQATPAQVRQRQAWLNGR